MVAISVAFYGTQLDHLPWLSLQFYLGTLLAIFGTMLNLRSTRFTAWLGSISLGVYLAHPLCAAALVHVFSLQNVWIELVGTIVFSMVLAEVYRRFESYWWVSPKFQSAER